MWDLVTYIDRDLSLLVRERKGAYALYAYPWKEPVKTDAPTEVGKPELINVQGDRLFAELTVRARFCAFNQITRLARGNLNGKIPTSLEQLHTEALKFALRRFKNEQITSEDFIGMLRSAALIAPIPPGFWNYLATFLKPVTLEKLKQSMTALAIFHEGGEDQWLEGQLGYMSKTAWFANDFDNIQTSCMQLAIIFSEHALKDDFSELGRKAKSQLMRDQIEADQVNQKPWQRSGHGVKKSVRSGPTTRPVKKPQDGEGDDKQ
jgi:hypothetical protein